MSDTPLRDALEKIGRDGDGLSLDIEADKDHKSVEFEGTKTLGKGWSISGAVAWAKDTGASVLGKIRWTPKS